MNTYNREGAPRGKQFQLNAVASLIWFLFFQIAISFLAYVATFSAQIYLGEATSSHFFRVATLT